MSQPQLPPTAADVAARVQAHMDLATQEVSQIFAQGGLTVDQLIERLEQQREYGRGHYRVSVRPLGSRRRDAQPLVVVGLPEECGEQIAIFTQPLPSPVQVHINQSLRR